MDMFTSYGHIKKHDFSVASPFNDILRTGTEVKHDITCRNHPYHTE